ncbi:uncharacterized protein LOC107484546 [Arachis duranensis]|uniref:Uncharacterized protein LOC107484546 n=1 Tax=Arachis duranensis TaxID=130453 RepID=A0A9C6WI41_ARADU|nr:uncharacterized protein LOC112794991 [Arachis hypogaea]XP_052116537.1 uncharacterized protein LOC107484546 [Arachis duranensis]
MKKHLAKIGGDIKKCSKVLYDVEKEMEGLLKEIQKSKTSKGKVSFNEEGTDEIEDAIDEAIAQEEQQTPCQLPTKKVIGGDPKKKVKIIIPPMFAQRTTPKSQPSMKSVFQNKEALHEVDKRVARWLLDCRILFNAVMSPFFQDMLDGVAGIGPGYKGPSYDKLRVNLLADLKRECFKCGKNASSLCDLFSEVIEWIGPDNIVHVVTDNATNYVAAGRLINKKFENIHSSPFAAHCLNLILKDISSTPHISNLTTCASKIIMFVYNHTVFLSWLRQRTDCKEIVHPGATRFATIFITLKSIFERKSDLQALVVDTHFTEHKLGRSANGRAVSAIILDNKFWNDCFTACKIGSPLIKLLRLVDADDKPSLGIVYEAYFLNPACFFDENYREAPDVMRCLLDLVILHCKMNGGACLVVLLHVYKTWQFTFLAKHLLLQDEIDADLDQGGGGGSSSTFYAAPLAFSGPSSENEGDDINDANLQQVMEDVDD